MVHRGLAEFEQPFGKNASTRAGDDFAKHSVGFPGPDIIGACTEHIIGKLIEHMPHQRHHGVIGSGADVDDVVAAFEPFVPRWMPEQPLSAFDDGDNLLARGRSVATDEDRKSTRLNSSHVSISYAVFCLKKK